jgi:hypothetical protein
MNKLVFKLLFLLPIPMILAGVNYYSDPAHIFDSKTYLENAVSYLHAGKNVANLVNYDDRLFQKMYIEQMERSKEIVVLGSSRCMQISKNLFPNNSFHNFSVSGSDIEDMLTIFNLLDKHDKLPKKIILGIDPWVLNGNYKDSRWKSLAPEYNSMLNKFDNSKYNINLDVEQAKYLKFRLSELFSFVYFQASINNINENYFPTNEEKLDNYVLRKDGSFYEYGYSKRKQDEINKLATEFDYNSSDNFTELDSRKKELLQDLLKYLKQKGIEILVFIPPFHPITFNNIISKIPMYYETTSYINDLSDKLAFKVIGNNNPGDFELLDSDFYDGMHMTQGALEKKFKFSFN